MLKVVLKTVCVYMYVYIYMCVCVCVCVCVCISPVAWRVEILSTVQDTWRRAWQPTPVLLPGEFHGRRSLVGYSPWGRKESDTAEWLTYTHTYMCVCLCIWCIFFWREGMFHHILKVL